MSNTLPQSTTELINLIIKKLNTQLKRYVAILGQLQNPRTLTSVNEYNKVLLPDLKNLANKYIEELDKLSPNAEQSEEINQMKKSFKNYQASERNIIKREEEASAVEELHKARLLQRQGAEAAAEKKDNRQKQQQKKKKSQKMKF